VVLAASRRSKRLAFVHRRLDDPRRLRNGMTWLIATALAYAVCILILAAGGAEPGNVPPWLTIPSATYFWWEAAFIAPVIIAAAVLTAGSMYLLARLAGGSGSFDDTLSLLGPAIAGCTLFTLIPDLIIGILLNTGALAADTWMHDITHPSLTLGLVWTYLSLYTLAFLVVFPIVAAAAHRLRVVPAIVIGWASFAVYQGCLFIFVR
jgi:hypothetical protein